MYIITDKIRLVNIVEREILDYFERSEKGRGNPSATYKNIHLSSFIIHHSLKTRRGGFHIRPFLFGLRAIRESPLRAKD